MSCLDDVQALVASGEETLRRIQTHYRRSLSQKAIHPELALEIKRLLEDLWSALDYLAREIAERYTALPSNSKCYFPLSSKDAHAFRSHMGKYFPGLQAARPDIYTILESIQPYVASGMQWLPKFAALVNENKHDRLSPQTRTEERSLRIDFSGGASIGLGKGSISGYGSIHSGGATVHLQGEYISGDSPGKHVSGDVKQTVTVWISFRFDAIGEEVMSFLTTILGGVKEIAAPLGQRLRA